MYDKACGGIGTDFTATTDWRLILKSDLISTVAEILTRLSNEGTNALDAEQLRLNSRDA